jgi:hypothetical protein
MRSCTALRNFEGVTCWAKGADTDKKKNMHSDVV